MFKINNKSTRTASMMSFLCFYSLLWTYFLPFSSVSFVDFEQIDITLAG